MCVCVCVCVCMRVGVHLCGCTSLWECGSACRPDVYINLHIHAHRNVHVHTCSEVMYSHAH